MSDFSFSGVDANWPKSPQKASFLITQRLWRSMSANSWLIHFVFFSAAFAELRILFDPINTQPISLSPPETFE
jgi:hypothetical protein